MNGSDLLRVRLELGMSSRELAARLGVTEADIERWETGETALPVDLAQRVPLLARSPLGGPVKAEVAPASRVLDSHYDQILHRLAGSLDPVVFERCAADLLRSEHPGAFAIGGGGDEGWDGVVPAGSGDWTAILATTRERPEQNLRTNIPNLATAARPPRGAILATNRRLSAAQKLAFRQIADDLGVSLVGIYDAEWFASSLYRNSEWCRRLLGLAGAPPALGPRAKGQRAAYAGGLLGREHDKEWLLGTAGDLLVLAAPGAGKTSLLQELVWEGRALFVNSTDLAAIADSLRRLDPEVVLVDDAHSDPAFLEALVHLRNESGFRARIVASAWPSARARLIRALGGLPLSQVRTLEEIDRDTMVQIVRAVGLLGPNALLAAIVRQADGRPGLAVTLSRLCLAEGVERVWMGDALVEVLEPHLEDMAGPGIKFTLAAFAVGGSSGMRFDVVAEILGVPLPALRAQIDTLGAAGLVRDLPEDRIAVEPEALRSVLVRDTFFRGESRVFERLLSSAPHAGAATRLLMGVRARRGNVPLDLIVERLRTQYSDDDWRLLASLGRDEALRAFEERSDLLLELAPHGLSPAGPEYIDALLAAAVDEISKRGSSIESLRDLPRPLEVLRTWVRAARPTSRESARRRRLVVERAATSAASLRLPIVAVAAMCLAVDPTFDSTESDPGSGRSFTITTGFLTRTEIEEFPSLLRRAAEVAVLVGGSAWHLVSECVAKWLYPGIQVPGDVSEVMRALESAAREVLPAVVEATASFPALQQRLAALARRVGVDLSIRVDRTFERLFPPSFYEGDEDHDEWMNRASVDIKTLVDEWGTQGVQEVVDELMRCERAAAVVGKSFPRLTPLLCDEFARRVDQPAEWAHCLRDAGAPVDLLHPFLVHATRVFTDEAESLCTELLGRDLYSRMTALLILTRDDAPEPLRQRALAMAPVLTHAIRIALLRREIGPATTRQLLQDDDIAVVEAAVVGEWQGGKPHGARPDLAEIWQQAALSCRGQDPWLGHLLEQEPPLAEEWAGARFRELASLDATAAYRVHSTLEHVLPKLSASSRAGLVESVPADALTWELARLLVGDDVSVYEAMLRRTDLRDVWCAPLARVPGSAWRELLFIGLQAGIPTDRVETVVTSLGEGWSGSEAAHWEERRRAFDVFRSDSDPRIRRIAAAGADDAQRRAKRAGASERREAIHGEDD